MKHGYYHGLCCIALKTSEGRRIWHAALGRLLLRLEVPRWWKPMRRRASFYRANAFQFGPFVIYWRDKRPKELKH